VIKKEILIPILVLVGFLSAVPSAFSEYYVGIFLVLLINFILVASYRFMVNIGMWSFSHISLMGMGAYTAALLVARTGLSFWVALPLGVLAAVATSLIICLPVLRTRGFYFFLTTFAAGQAMWWSWVLFDKVFGGFRGSGAVYRPEPIGDLTSYYYLVLGFTLLSLIILYRLEKSRIGATISAVRSSEELSEAMGMNVGMYRTMVFVIASTFAGLAGVLLTFYSGTASPQEYSVNYGLNILIYVIVGGTGSFVGPIVGASILTAVYETLRGFQILVPLIFGVILIVMVLFQRGGLVAIPSRISSWVEKLKRKKSTRHTTAVDI